MMVWYVMRVVCDGMVWCIHVIGVVHVCDGVVCDGVVCNGCGM